MGPRVARVKKGKDDARYQDTIAAMLPDKTKAVNYFKFAAALLTSDGPLRGCNHREIRFFDVLATVQQQQLQRDANIRPAISCPLAPGTVILTPRSLAQYYEEGAAAANFRGRQCQGGSGPVCLAMLVMASPGVRGRTRRSPHAPVAHGASRAKLIFGVPYGTDWSGALPAVVPCACIWRSRHTGRWDRQRGDRAHRHRDCLFGEFKLP